MRFEDAAVAVQRSRESRRAWLNALRIFVGFASLAGAFYVAWLLQPRLDPAAHRRVFLGLLAGAFVVFALMMLWLGRDVSRRWIEFGQTLGFAPASRRAFFDFGTDRPVLLGSAGRHPARLKLVLTTTGRRGQEWIQADVDLLGACERAWIKIHGARFEASDWRLEERARVLVAEWSDPATHVHAEGGRLTMRRPFVGFDDEHARTLLRDSDDLARAIERPL